MRKNLVPSYLFHKSTGQARVRIDGRDHYLGEFGSVESKAKYDELVSDFIEKERREHLKKQMVQPITSKPFIVESMAEYLRHCAEYYKGSRERGNIVNALRFLKPFGRTLVDDFRASDLRDLRDAMIKSGLTRQGINKRICKIRGFFRWCHEMERGRPDLWALTSVKPLMEGRSRAPESKQLPPVSDEHIEAIRPYVSNTIWTMIQLQRHSAARPGEICGMRPCDIDQTGDVWVYRPTKHKTKWRGKTREIYLGPKCQLLLKPWLKPDRPEEHVFQPREAVKHLRIKRATNRKTPISCGNRRGSNRKTSPRRLPGVMYNTGSYGNAVRRACEKAGTEPWSPNAIRKRSATSIRQEFGIEFAQSALGHAKCDTTEIYAQVGRERGMKVAREVG